MTGQPLIAPDARQRWLTAGVCVFLAATIWTVFGQTLWHGFIGFDDNEYVYDNPEVSRGLTVAGIAWAFTHTHSANWHPLTWISHMLDCEMYGLHASGHHLTNVLLHTATAIVFFFSFRAMTGSGWRSAFTAAVFAVHPLRVESVAWVAERKDVLSGLFFALTLAAYARYAREPSLTRHLAVFCLLSAGLMSKPSLVTAPVVLLLLDYWPLDRFRPRTPARLWSLLAEKLPLLALSIGSAVVTMAAQRGSVSAFESLPLSLRIVNAVASYVEYIWQMIYPLNLAVLYPYSFRGLPMWEVTAAALFLLCVSLAVLAARHRHPYLLVGWFWYLGMLIPMIGLVQVGLQSHADRYTYLPQIGLYVLIAWALADLVPARRDTTRLLWISAGIVIATLMTLAYRQTSLWQSSEVLWQHTIAHTPPNALAHNNLAVTLMEKDRVDDAMAHCLKALKIRPNYANAHYNLAMALMKKNATDAAIPHYLEALAIKPDFAAAENNLGMAFMKKGELDEALKHYRKALEIEPGFPNAYFNLGLALTEKGQTDDAVTAYRKALEGQSQNPEAHYNLGIVLTQKGRLEEANAHFGKALELNPGHTEAHNNLGINLMQQGRLDEAIAQFGEALENPQGSAKAQFNLAAALVRTGRADEAIRHFKEGLGIEPGDARAHYELGMAFLQQRSVHEAQAEWEKAFALDPSNSAAPNQMAWVLATWPDRTVRNGPKAVELGEQANRLSGGRDPVILDTLAAAYAECGRFSKAVEIAEQALELSLAQKNSGLAEALQREIELYKSGLPLGTRGETNR